MKGVTGGLEAVTDALGVDQLSQTVDSVSPGVDTVVDTLQTSLDEMKITDVDSVLDETQDIVEGATDGVGQITDSLEQTGLDRLTETVSEHIIVLVLANAIEKTLHLKLVKKINWKICLH